MASQLKVDTLTGVTTAGAITITLENSESQILQKGLAKVTAHLTLAGVSNADAALNVSSVADGGTGKNTLSVTNAPGANGINNATSGEGFSYAHSTSGFGSLSSQTTGNTNFSSFTGTNIYVRSRFIYSESDSFDGIITSQVTYNGKSNSDAFSYALGECFDLDTLILMSDNTTKKLRDIETGDVVKTWSILDMPNTDDKNTVITTIEDLSEDVAERIDQVSKLVADEKNNS